MDRHQFSRFEERIQALVEGGFARLFAGRLQPREVALRMAHAMEDHARPGTDGAPIAPNRYAVHLHPADAEALSAHQPDLTEMLAAHLVSLARESGLRLDAPPQVFLVPDATVTLHTAVVLADHISVAREATQVMQSLPPREPEASSDAPAAQAYLIVNGQTYIPLERSVINIGRRRDNTIVLDDPRVSRHHCQVRYRFGAYVLYDLGSRAGTYVNDQRVSEVVLQPGDVIALAGVRLVYTVDEQTTSEYAPHRDTQLRMQPAEPDNAPEAAPDEDDAD
ncbi:MAG: DUF3662 and FHA domain-containing protein [Chloroflexota bacterium]|jgi:hypothetical protein|nr:DUF3662 and FHA domain-containing protein [Aggregatilineaceae bacterium]